MSVVRERPPAVAGKFYPADPKDLESAVDGFIRGGILTIESRGEKPGAGVKAIIGPHAGYMYSGPIAGTTYGWLQSALGPAALEKITRVVLAGPCHFVPVDGIATSSADQFRTPLGPVPLDRESIDAIASLPQVCVNDEAHAPDHALETHLPFLQRSLPGSFKVVPLLVGRSNRTEVAEVFDLLWGGEETLIVISSDLSHFMNYQSATAIDQSTAASIVDLDADALAPDRACGCYSIKGLIECARRREMRCRLLDLRNSGDTAGDPDRVVGYGSFAFD